MAQAILKRPAIVSWQVVVSMVFFVFIVLQHATLFVAGSISGFAARKALADQRSQCVVEAVKNPGIAQSQA